LGKEVVGKPSKILSKLYTFSRKGIEPNHFTTNLQKGVTAMKKRNMLIGCLVLLMLIATLLGCASTSKQEGTGEYVDDSVITTKVKSALAVDDFLKSFEISVETYKGIVQLTGFVDSQKAVDKAAEVARGVKGVKSVKNDLNVKK
jgi:hyperosmotically inducible protein